MNKYKLYRVQGQTLVQVLTGTMEEAGVELLRYYQKKGVKNGD